MLVRSIARRLVHALAVLFGVSVLTFVLAELAPGNYVDRLRLEPSMTPETLRTMTEELALEEGVVERYATWIGSLARLELGYSYRTGLPVALLVTEAARNTLLLGVTATTLAWLIALPLGIWSAASRRPWVAPVTEGGTSVLLAPGCWRASSSLARSSCKACSYV